ncbi:MAG: cob(I)yrinic acid a,c-diamide adenosyltransferase [Georgfuchsia sp.]
MGYRLSKIYTRTGDEGATGLGDGSRTGKDALRIATMGDLDELNSLLGLLLCEDLPEEVRTLLSGIQNDLFDLGGEVSIPGHTLLGENQPARLETAIDRFNGELQPLKEFILPGGNRAAAITHLARAVCRRAERKLVALARDEAVTKTSRQYVNRLSDLLFVLGRWLNKAAGGSDVLWHKNKNS